MTDIIFGTITGLACMVIPACLTGLLWLHARTRADRERAIRQMWVGWGRKDTQL